MRKQATVVFTLLAVVWSWAILRPGAAAQAPQGGVQSYDSGITTLPTAAAQPTALAGTQGTTTLVTNLFCANTTGIAATITITDNQTSPVTYVPASSLAANSTVQFVSGGRGLVFQKGIKWSAGTASAINCQITGWQ